MPLLEIVIGHVAIITTGTNAVKGLIVVRDHGQKLLPPREIFPVAERVVLIYSVEGLGGVHYVVNITRVGGLSSRHEIGFPTVTGEGEHEALIIIQLYHQSPFENPVHDAGAFSRNVDVTSDPIRENLFHGLILPVLYILSTEEIVTNFDGVWLIRSDITGEIGVVILFGSQVAIFAGRISTGDITFLKPGDAESGLTFIERDEKMDVFHNVESLPPVYIMSSPHEGVLVEPVDLWRVFEVPVPFEIGYPPFHCR